MILRIPTILIVALAAHLIPQVSYAGKLEPSALNRLDAVFIDLPIDDIDGKIHNGECPSFTDYGPDKLDERNIHKIFFDRNGSVYWDDEKVADDILDNELKSDLVANGQTELHIQPLDNAPSGPIINLLKRVIDTGFPCYGFVGNESYRKIWRPKSPHTRPWKLSSIDLSPPPERNKAVPPIAIQIISTDNEGRAFHDPGFAGVSSTGRCRAFFGEKPVSNDELYDLANKAIWSAVNEAGGQEKFLKGERGPQDVPDAIILTTPNTPWRCVGGGVFNLQLSGFLSIGFTLIPDSQ